MSLPLMWSWFRQGSMLWRDTRHHWGDTNSQPSVSGQVPFTLTHLHCSTHQHTAFALLPLTGPSRNITKKWVINIRVCLSLCPSLSLSVCVCPSLVFFFALLVHGCITFLLFCGLSVWSEREKKNHTLLGRIQRFILHVCYSSFCRFHDGIQSDFFLHTEIDIQKYVILSFSFTHTTLIQPNYSTSVKYFNIIPSLILQYRKNVGSRRVTFILLQFHSYMFNTAL